MSTPSRSQHLSQPSLPSAALFIQPLLERLHVVSRVHHSVFVPLPLSSSSSSSRLFFSPPRLESRWKPPSPTRPLHLARMPAVSLDFRRPIWSATCTPQIVGFRTAAAEEIPKARFWAWRGDRNPWVDYVCAMGCRYFVATEGLRGREQRKVRVSAARNDGG
ncbi:hypothetical protein GGI35DRAFT_33592 [Trichoderma velutinum]